MRTKMVATLGPACQEERTITKMIDAGVDVFRVNFSHAQPESTSRIVNTIKKIREERDLPVAILGDIRGPRIRVGDLKDGQINLHSGQKLSLIKEQIVGDNHTISVSYPRLGDDVKPASVILIDNGTIILKVEQVDPIKGITCTVQQGGLLSSRRGLNLPGIQLSIPILTDKDYRDIDFAISNHFDFLALSFVQTADDLIQLKAYLSQKQSEIPVIAKIENQQALRNISSIASEAYGVMVARGDLALEMSIQDVPIAQKKIISVCRKKAIPVITATQILESMITNRQPTRAEATDIANAILDGTDALMLSGETAIGNHPVLVVETMSNIARCTEKAWVNGEVSGPPDFIADNELDATIAYASTVVAQSLEAAAIITHTTTGSTARRVAKHRPNIPILALTPDKRTKLWLALSWGVETAIVGETQSSQDVVDYAVDQSTAMGISRSGDTLVITAGAPLKASGKTNLIRVHKIP